MRANPQVGSISGTVWLTYLTFMLGAVIAVTALLSGLQRATHDEAGGWRSGSYEYELLTKRSLRNPIC